MVWVGHGEGHPLYIRNTLSELAIIGTLDRARSPDSQHCPGEAVEGKRATERRESEVSRSSQPSIRPSILPRRSEAGPSKWMCRKQHRLT